MDMEMEVEVEKHDQNQCGSNNVKESSPDQEPSPDPENVSEPVSEERACCSLSKSNSLRKGCIWLMKSRWFDRVTLLIILLNCIMISLYNYCDEKLNCRTGRCLAAVIIDYLIFAYFLVEMVIKMIAMGGCGPNSYFVSNWNKLDFIIVLTGVSEYIVKLLQLETNLRALRVLRIVQRTLQPLRSVNRVAALRIVTNMVLDTVPMLLNVLLVCAMVFFVFGLVAVQLWAGLLRARCTFNHADALNVTSMWTEQPYYIDPLYGQYICSLPQSDGLHKCEDLPPQICTSEAEQVFYNDPIPCTPGTQFNTCTLTETNPYFGLISFDNIFSAWITIFVVISMDGWSEIMYMVQDAHSFWVLIYFILLIIIGAMFTVNLFLVVMTTQISITKARELSKMEEESRRREDELNSLVSVCDEDMGMYRTLLHFVGKWCRHTFYAMEKVLCRRKWEEHERKRVRRLMIKRGSLVMDTTEWKKKSRFIWITFARGHIKKLAESEKFAKFVLLAIVLNSFSMAVEYHNQPENLTNIIEVSNYVFTSIFIIEMVLKIIGFGFYGYIKELFNVFDFVIVIISILEMANLGPEGLSVLRTFRLLRLIKLIRFMPVLHQLLTVIINTLDEIAVFLGLFCLVIVIFSLTGMILFGQRLSMRPDGGSCDCMDLNDDSAQCIHQRSNFDSFSEATLTVFQVLTVNNWRFTFFNTMHKTTGWIAAFYFIALFTIGNYVMLNLVVAILVQGCMELSQKLRGRARGELPNSQSESCIPSDRGNTARLNPFSKEIFEIQLLNDDQLQETSPVEECHTWSESEDEVSAAKIVSARSNKCNFVSLERNSVQRFIDETDEEAMARLCQKFNGRITVGIPANCPESEIPLCSPVDRDHP